jgi:hypothetical protein
MKDAPVWMRDMSQESEKPPMVYDGQQFPAYCSECSVDGSGCTYHCFVWHLEKYHRIDVLHSQLDLPPAPLSFDLPMHYIVFHVIKKANELYADTILSKDVA